MIRELKTSVLVKAGKSIFLILGSFLLDVNTLLSQNISYEEIQISCLNLGSLPKELKISNERELENILTASRSPHPECTSNIFPKIDFESRILLGFRTNAGGCSPPQYSIKFYSENNESVFEVTIRENGLCRPLYQKVFWVIIPKEFGENVTFRTVKKKGQ